MLVNLGFSKPYIVLCISPFPPLWPEHDGDDGPGAGGGDGEGDDVPHDAAGQGPGPGVTRAHRAQDRPHGQGQPHRCSR